MLCFVYISAFFFVFYCVSALQSVCVRLPLLLSGLYLHPCAPQSALMDLLAPAQLGQWLWYYRTHTHRTGRSWRVVRGYDELRATATWRTFFSLVSCLCDSILVREGSTCSWCVNHTQCFIFRKQKRRCKIYQIPLHSVLYYIFFLLFTSQRPFGLCVYLWMVHTCHVRPPSPSIFIQTLNRPSGDSVRYSLCVYEYLYRHYISLSTDFVWDDSTSNTPHEPLPPPPPPKPFLS